MLIDCCFKYANENDIFYNEKKTVLMCVKPSNMKHLFVPPIYLGQTKIKCVSKEKYLGHIINEEQRDDSDIERQVASIYARGNLLIRKFKYCTSNVKSQLFKTFCSSFYCSSVWSVFNKSTFYKLKMAYNNVFRKFFNVKRQNSISGKMLDFKIDPFSVVVRKSCLSLFTRLKCSYNRIILTIISCDNFGFSLLFKKWNECLFT